MYQTLLWYVHNRAWSGAFHQHQTCEDETCEVGAIISVMYVTESVMYVTDSITYITEFVIERCTSTQNGEMDGKPIMQDK